MVHVVMEMGDTDFRSLLHSMSEKKKLPLTMILYYWTEMLTAVKHIHDNGEFMTTSLTKMLFTHLNTY